MVKINATITTMQSMLELEITKFPCSTIFIFTAKGDPTIIQEKIYINHISFPKHTYSNEKWNESDGQI